MSTLTRNTEDQQLYEAARILSPCRKSSHAETITDLAEEQMAHFGIDRHSEYGEAMYECVLNLYRAQGNMARIWEITNEALAHLDKGDKIAWFNAKKFLSFQLAKILDTLQNPFRKTYQNLQLTESSRLAKGPFPIFDNVTALFSANPVIVRTATYIYACTEWVDDAFQGREMLHEIYSRLLNPTSISLANHIVDVEAGPYANQYMAWNFNSGMAAIDALLGHLLQAGDILVVSRHVYGGVYQLMHDYYARPEKLNIQLEWFDGYDAETFETFLLDVEQRHKCALARGQNLYVYMESPCNPFGYVVDIPEIAKISHERGYLVIHDATVGTPFLNKPLQRENHNERPDFVVHSYTKDLTGNGNATAGVVIGENHRMFLPKGDTFGGVAWNDTLFWGVYYIKGAFLDSDKAFEVLSGMKTLEMRMLRKCVNTLVMARWLDAHPKIRVNCNALEHNENYLLRDKVLRKGLAAPLFTIDFEDAQLSRATFVRFFDSLAPGLDHQVSLGQSNTVCLCPALTSHSELDKDALAAAGIYPTTVRIAVGTEHPIETLAHLQNALKLIVDPVSPGFSEQFLSATETDRLFQETYTEVHRNYAVLAPKMAALLDED